MDGRGTIRREYGSVRPMGRDNASAVHGLLALAWLSGGVVVAGLFASAQLLPFRATIIVLAVTTVVGIASLRITELSMMSRLFVFLFVLPFSATLGYLFDRDFVWWQTPTNTLLCMNHPLINEMLTMVIVGLCGLMAGLEFMATYMAKPTPIVREPATNSAPNPTLTLPVVWVLLGISFVGSWLHAPEQSIFTARYASADAGGGLDKDVGMNASYLISYLILVLLFVDAERERPGSRRQILKLAASLAVTGYIVLFLQLLCGDRECAGLVGAMGMLYISSPATQASRAKFKRKFQQMNRTLKLFGPLAVAVVAFIALGSLRHSASQTNTEKAGVLEVIMEGFTQNTWTAVALNNLGLSADYNYGNLEYLYGRTYLDYFLSLPPGAITMALGYERPMETDANPAAWYFGLIAAGGMHPVVVPFRNLGIWGVLGILFLSGMFICYCEINNERGTLFARLLYGCIATSSMLWFWYGDMNFIRTVMLSVILAVFHMFVAHRPLRNMSQSPARSPIPTRPTRKPIGAMS